MNFADLYAFGGSVGPSKTIVLFAHHGFDYGFDVMDLTQRASALISGFHLIRGDPDNIRFSWPVYALVT